MLNDSLGQLNEINLLPQNSTIEGLPYGIHVIPPLDKQYPQTVLCSAPSFQELLVMLIKLKDIKAPTVVVTPELITEVNENTLAHEQVEIDSRINEVLKVSTHNPNLQVLLGSPYWQNEQCYNAVIVISRGEIKQIISKTLLTPGEDQDFASSLDAKPALVGVDNTAVLICSDLNAAGMFPSVLEEKLRNQGIELPHAPQLINDSATILLVSSCWGSGSNSPRSLMAGFGQVRSGRISLDDFIVGVFKSFLRGAVINAFEKHPHLEIIIVCDRAPIMRSLEPEAKITSYKPMSGIFYRKDIQE